MYVSLADQDQARQAKEGIEVDPAKGVVFPKRMGDPAEFALAVEMIVRNPYLNGETIRLDAALRLAGG